MATTLPVPLTQNLNLLRLNDSTTISAAFPVASCSSVRGYTHISSTHICKASDNLQGGVPSELELESKFVSLNVDDPQYGPPALLLLGFDIEETTQIKEFLKSLDGEFLKIIHCTEDMISSSLWEAIDTQQPDLTKVKIAKSVPRICFLSGLTGEEMIMFIDAFPESGLEPAVFAALVPNNGNKLLAELIDEVMGDHEMVTEKGSGSSV